MMTKPDFTRYSLALMEGDTLIYSTLGGGLRPLWDALEKHAGKSGLILHDKVMGLAAARLIVHAGVVAEIITLVASLPAKKYLEDNGIKLNAFNISANIMTQDRSAVCPGERIAQETDGEDDFIGKIRLLLGV
ncbi:MAG: DUF1893 domain-containing protein [Smithellaceae bacterium]